MNMFRSPSPSQILDADPQTAVRLIADGAVLLDVRDLDEWTAGHSPTAQHLALADLSVDALPTGRIIVAVCRSGARSARAAAALSQAGFEVRNLAGGMQAWAAAGLPVVAADGRPGVIA